MQGRLPASVGFTGFPGHPSNQGYRGIPSRDEDDAFPKSFPAADAEDGFRDVRESNWVDGVGFGYGRNSVHSGQGDSEHDNAHIAAGKAISYLLKMEGLGYCGVERSSVYGAAVAIPQIARSVGWSTTMTGLAIRSYIFLLFNIFLQLFLVTVLNEELHLFNPLSGRMHLCDFGADVSKCPNGANCKGPGGTTYQFRRLYGFTVWQVRVFARDSLLALFPERADDIQRLVDPGEYGVEDYYCRLCCCLIFMMAVMQDLKGTLGLWVLLRKVPTKGESWMTYEVPRWDAKEKVKQVHDWTELDLVQFRVAGIPMTWKIVNFVFVLVPKAYIWWTLVSSGFHFLLETPDIVDCVINCMALTFVLDIDECVFERLATVASKHMMENLQDMALFETEEEEQETDAQAAERFRREEFGPGHNRRLLELVLPKRLMWILFFVACFVAEYYLTSCLRTEDGSWISKDLFVPTDITYNPLSFLYAVFRKNSDEPIWSMPEGDDAEPG